MVPVSVFFSCRFCSLGQNTGFGHPDWLMMNSWDRAEWFWQAGSVQTGRDLAVGALRVMVGCGVKARRAIYTWAPMCAGL